MKYHALFVIFEKVAKFFNCRLLQIIGGALRVNKLIYSAAQVFFYKTLLSTDQMENFILSEVCYGDLIKMILK